MRHINTHQAKTHLSQLLEEVAAGEEIVIAKAGRPVARLVPLEASSGPRRPGRLTNRLWIGEDPPPGQPPPSTPGAEDP